MKTQEDSLPLGESGCHDVFQCQVMLSNRERKRRSGNYNTDYMVSYTVIKYSVMKI